MIVAVDQSSTCCGWAVFTKLGAMVASGQVKAEKTKELNKRLGLFIQCKQLANATMKQAHGAIVSYSKGLGAIKYDLLLEEVSFFKQKSGHTVYAMGTITTLLMNEAIGMRKVVFTPPPRIKSIMTGSGRADKDDIIKAVTHTLRLDYVPKEDEADAIAHAYIYSKGLLQENTP